MKKKFLRILNRYSLLYLPTGWVIGLGIIFIAYEPITVLYFLSLFVLGIFGFLILYNWVLLRLLTRLYCFKIHSWWI